MNIPADYIDVAERIRLFKEMYPEGSLQGESKGIVLAGDRSFIVYRAEAYRTPDDARPGIGWAWEPVPGPTPFTKDSELMNAETSAWGRAIVALGLPTKKIASSEEVRNRQEPKPAADEKPSTPGQHDEIKQLVAMLEKEHPIESESDPGYNWMKRAQGYVRDRFDKPLIVETTMAEAHQLREYLEEERKAIKAAEDVPFG